MLAELVRLTQCTPEDPCYVAKEWHGQEVGRSSEPLGACWKVVLRQSGEAVGNGGLLVLDELDRVAELYFRLEADQAGSGIRVAAVRALINLGFEELELEKIRAWCLDTERDIREVYRKAGMELEEVLPESRCVRGHWHDSHLFCARRRE